MTERSTARSTDGATQDHDDPASVRDGWIARRSRLEASDPDSYYERQRADAPQWREESYPPGDAHQEHAHQRPDPLDYPEQAHYKPEQTYQEERQDQGPYGPTAAYPVQDDLYAAQQERHAQPEEDSTHEESDAYGPDTDEGRSPRRKHHRELDARPGPTSRRRFWLIPVSGLAVGALLFALAFTWGSDQTPEDVPPLSAASNPLDPLGKPTTPTEMPSMSPSSATPHNPSATPSVTPTDTPTATPSVTPTDTPTDTSTATPPVTPTQDQSADPVLLGPSSKSEVTNMVKRYCARHTGGSAKTRNDGRWQCTKLLSSSIVDMDVACRDTYDSDAYARASDPGDPYTWRCYH